MIRFPKRRSGDSNMLQLEPTTLFYYNLTFRSFDKSVNGFIDNWASDLPPPGSATGRSKVSKSAITGKISTSRYSTPTSAAAAKGKAKVKAKVLSTAGKSESRLKPISEPLRLLDTSDEEYLRGDKQTKNAVSCLNLSIVIR
jgi:hypothetical protein